MRRVSILGVLGLALSVTGSAAALPAPMTLLTYAVSLAGQGESDGLCIARPDGTARIRLTRGFQDRSPAWSPDGRYVAFSRRVPGEPTSRIFVADAGGHVVRQFGSGLFNTDPAWSPSGDRIAYAAGERGASRIVIANAMGQVIVEVPVRFAVASRPTWSSDGKWLAYAERLEADAGGEGAVSRIVLVAADGRARHPFATGAADPAWSPDGSEIAYVAYTTRWLESGDITIASATGHNKRRLTATPAGEFRPSWSPDGKLLAFVRGSERESVIVVTGRDGRGENVAIRSQAYLAFDPAWRPPAGLPVSPQEPCP